MDELKPCPFCGGESQTNSNGKEIVCLSCECLGPFCDTETEAIEAWNTRTELCRRTCSITDTTVAWNDDVHTTALCSECGEEYTVDFGYLNYCPNCGAKVISE